MWARETEKERNRQRNSPALVTRSVLAAFSRTIHSQTLACSTYASFSIPLSFFSCFCVSPAAASFYHFPAQPWRRSCDHPLYGCASWPFRFRFWQERRRVEWVNASWTTKERWGVSHAPPVGVRITIRQPSRPDRPPPVITFHSEIYYSLTSSSTRTCLLRKALTRTKIRTCR